MNSYKEIYPYVSLFMVLVSSLLAVALAVTVRNLAGRGWLIASASLGLFYRPAFQIVSILAHRSPSADSVRELYRWDEVLGLLPLFATACFGLFLFANWSKSRMRLDLRNLLFSFSGRIPRSAFWIAVCILFPLGTLVGFAPYVSEASGLAKGIILTIYAVWCVLSIWISLAVYATRWHDCSKSGWMTLVLFIPVIGFFWFFGYLGFVRGAGGSNQFGDDPLETTTG
jgi:uncharacterized membrane protein YhaH (DUF805 family)